jgi:steroid delta-isomerase-like uncharacterized protein
MTRDEILELIGRWQAAFRRRDLETYTGLYAEQAVLESPLAGSLSGRAAVTRFVGAFLSSFPDATITSEPAIVDGSRAAILSSVTGSHVGTFMGLSPTGKAFRFSMVFMLVIRDGQIVSDRRIYDFTGFLVQLSVLKAKPA